MKGFYYFAFLLSLSSIALTQTEWRSHDGKNNNLAQTSWGGEYESYLPLGNWAPKFADGVGSMMSGLPNARTITQTLLRNYPDWQEPEVSGLSMLAVSFGFLSLHDVGFRPDYCTEEICEPSTAAEKVNIPVPTCDDQWDPQCQGNQTIPFTRFRILKGSGKDGEIRRIPKIRTSWMDLDFVYGLGPGESRRVHQGNSSNLDPDYRKGQIYDLEEPQLANKTIFHLNLVKFVPQWWIFNHLWSLNHNSLATDFAQQHPEWDEETVYQTARKWNIALYQKLFTREYLAAITGKPLQPYKGYDPTLQPRVDPVFKHIVGRYGHFSFQHTGILLDSSFNQFGPGSVSSHSQYQNWEFFKQYFRQFLLGDVYSPSYEVHNLKIHSAYTKFTIFGDLPSTDMMRARDIGVPLYNDLRQAYGLQPISNWTQLTNNTKLISSLTEIYGSIDRLESYLGIHMETPSALGVHVGSFAVDLFHRQMENIRNSDRFWYEREGMFTSDELGVIYNTTLTSIIVKNFPDISNSLPLNPFFIPSRQLFGTAASSVLFPPLENAEIYDNQIDLSQSYRLMWHYSVKDQVIQFLLLAVTEGWVGIGWDADEGTMKNADIILCRVGVNGDVEVIDSYALDVGVPTRDEALGGTSDVFDISGRTYSGVTEIRFSRRINTDDVWDKPIRDEQQKIIFAFNSMTKEFLYHGPTRSSSRKLNFLRTVPVRDADNALRVITIVAVSIGFAFGLLVLLFTFIDEKQFRFASVLFVRVSIIGAFIGLISAVLMLKEPTNELCIASFWLLGVAFYIVFGLTLLKVHRLYQIYLEFSQQGMPSWKLPSNSRLLVVTSLLIFLECIFHIIWVTVDPLEAVLVNSSNNDFSWYKCDSSIAFWMVFVTTKLAFLGAAFVLCFLSRKIPHKFSESGRLSVLVYGVFVVIVIVLPLGFAVSDLNGRFVVQVFPVLIVFVGYLFVTFMPIVFRIIKKKPALGGRDLMKSLRNLPPAPPGSVISSANNSVHQDNPLPG